MDLSAFGSKFTQGAGILSLMDDLGKALNSGVTAMLGGGNPDHIPEIEACLAGELRRLAEDPVALRQLIGIYAPPQGDVNFRRALAGLLGREYGWQLGEEHICLTNGSQTAFFLLFNMLAGIGTDGSRRRILLPMAPEYIGYADQGLCEDFFVSVRPIIEEVDEHFFKYRVDFDRLTVNEQIAAICVSRPTNPTGNVLTDAEMKELSRLARNKGIPLIVDCAYGLPFPGMIYGSASPIWDEHIILCLSLSKLGLPAVRTGIVIAAPEVIARLAAANAVINLATSSFGPMLVTGLITSGELLRLAREVVRPYYQNRLHWALDCIKEQFAGLPYRVHVPEGAMFLWLWFPDLPLTATELYQRLKERGVVVVSGAYFFPGLESGWRHADECLRINYARDAEEVRQGIALLGDELRTVFSAAGGTERTPVHGGG